MNPQSILLNFLSSVYIEGLTIKILKNIIFLTLKIVVVLVNSAEPDEMPQNAA